MTQKNSAPIAVASRSFSRHPVLRAELMERYENVVFNDEGKSFSDEELVLFLSGKVKAITGLEVLNDSVLSRLPELKIVGKYGVGLDMIDLRAMKKHGKQLGWTGGVNRRSVAELALMFMLAALRQVTAAHHEVLQGKWRQHIGGQLTGRTIGIIGCGHVGKDLVGLLQPFGCNILAHDIREFPDFYAQTGVTSVSLESLLRKSDVVTLHVPLNASTRMMLNRDRLALMQPSSVLINTARGGLLDEAALKEMLKSGKLAGAAFDVFATEPLDDSELVALPNFLSTPHIGGSSQEAILAMGRAAIMGLDQAFDPESFIC